jgi:hypothetical protein
MPIRRHPGNLTAGGAFRGLLSGAPAPQESGYDAGLAGNRSQSGRRDRPKEWDEFCRYGGKQSRERGG